MRVKKHTSIVLQKLTSPIVVIVYTLIFFPTLIISLYLVSSPPTSTEVLGTTTQSSCGCYINGFPFIDSNRNGKYDTGESYYNYVNSTLTFSLYDSSGNLLAHQTQNAGQTTNPYWFSFNKLPTNSQYTVKLDSVPPGYVLITPQSYTVSVGLQCSTGGDAGAVCGQYGDVVGLNWGLVPSSIPSITSTKTLTLSQSTMTPTPILHEPTPTYFYPTPYPTFTPPPASTYHPTYYNPTFTPTPTPIENSTGNIPLQNYTYQTSAPPITPTPIHDTVITVNQPTSGNPPTYTITPIPQPSYKLYPYIPHTTSIPTPAMIGSRPTATVQITNPLLPTSAPIPSANDFGIFNLPNKSVVSGNITIQITNTTYAGIDLELLPLTGIPDSVYLGRGTLDAQHPTTNIQWDTRDTPNGQYNLYAKVYKQDGSTELINPVEITVQNAQNIANDTAKTLISGSAFVPTDVPVDAKSSVTDIRNTVIPSTKTLGLTFQGKSQPNSFVTVLIFSEPIMVTVRTDANGSWSYTLEKPLPPGNHSSYVVVNDNGAAVRSELKQFTIAPAQAGSDKDSLVLASATNDSWQLGQYLLIALGILLFAVIALAAIYFAHATFFNHAS